MSDASTPDFLPAQRDPPDAFVARFTHTASSSGTLVLRPRPSPPPTALQPPETLSSSQHLASIVRVRVGTKAKEEYDAEKHLKEKSERYSHLWQVVLRAEEELSRSFKGAFLKLDDTKASVLNAEVRNACLRKKRMQLKQKSICKKLFEYLELKQQ
jgi:hypothetical protein